MLTRRGRFDTSLELGSYVHGLINKLDPHLAQVTADYLAALTAWLLRMPIHCRSRISRSSRLVCTNVWERARFARDRKCPLGDLSALWGKLLYGRYPPRTGTHQTTPSKLRRRAGSQSGQVRRIARRTEGHPCCSGKSSEEGRLGFSPFATVLACGQQLTAAVRAAREDA
jgi:hypothetical protein